MSASLDELMKLVGKNGDKKAIAVLDAGLVGFARRFETRGRLVAHKASPNGCDNPL